MKMMQLCGYNLRIKRTEKLKLIKCDVEKAFVKLLLLPKPETIVMGSLIRKEERGIFEPINFVRSNEQYNHFHFKVPAFEPTKGYLLAP